MLTPYDYDMLGFIDPGLGCLASELDEWEGIRTNKRYRLSKLGYCRYIHFRSEKPPFAPAQWRLTDKGKAELAAHRKLGE
jgi:hypothetical protein